MNNNSGGGNNNNNGLASYKEALNELMSSLEGMNFGEANNCSPVSATKAPNLPWLDMSLINCDDQQYHQHQQFVLSPDQQQQFILSPSPRNTSIASSVSSANFSNGKLYPNSTFLSNETKAVSSDNGSSCTVPDLGWVNELLM